MRQRMLLMIQLMGLLVYGSMANAATVQGRALPPPKPSRAVTSFGAFLPTETYRQTVAPYLQRWKEARAFRLTGDIVVITGSNAAGEAELLYTDSTGRYVWSGPLLSADGRRNLSAELVLSQWADQGAAARLRRVASASFQPTDSQSQGGEQALPSLDPIKRYVRMLSVEGLSGLPFLSLGKGNKVVYALIDILHPNSRDIVKDLLSALPQQDGVNLRLLPVAIGEAVSAEQLAEVVQLYAPADRSEQLQRWLAGTTKINLKRYQAGLENYLMVVQALPPQALEQPLFVMLQPAADDAVVFRYRSGYSGLAPIVRDFGSSN